MKSVFKCLCGMRCLYVPFSVVFLLLGLSDSTFSETLYQADYDYDSRGFVTNLVEKYGDSPAKIRELGYDEMGRLTKEKLGAYEVQYVYDHMGNRIRQTSPSVAPQVYQYNSRNELLRQEMSSITNELSYDLNGSLIQKVAGTKIIGYVWDSRGRLVWVETNGVEVFRADYAGDLKRIRKTEGIDSTTYRHDEFTAIQQVDGAGSVKELMRADRGASTVGGVLYSADSDGTNTYTYNGVGSTVVLSEDDGEVKNVQYDVFGNILQKDEGVEEERLANTKELDESIGLYYHGARYYDAAIGRYISMDPARDGANHYVYANNAPLTYVDPTGLSSCRETWPEGCGLSRAYDTTTGRAVEGFWKLFKTADENKLLPVNPGNMALGYSATAVGTLGMVGGKYGNRISQWARRILGLGAKKGAEQVITKAGMQFVGDVPVIAKTVGVAPPNTSALHPPSPMTQQYIEKFHAKYGVDELGYGPQMEFRPINYDDDATAFAEFVRGMSQRTKDTGVRDYDVMGANFNMLFANEVLPSSSFQIGVDSSGRIKSAALHDSKTYLAFKDGKQLDPRINRDKRSRYIADLAGLGGEGGGYDMVSYMATRALIFRAENLALSPSNFAIPYYARFSRGGMQNHHYIWSSVEDIPDWGLLKSP